MWHDCGRSFDHAMPVKLPADRGDLREQPLATLLLRMDDSPVWRSQTVTVVPLVAAVLVAIALASLAVDVILKRVVLGPVMAITQVARRTALGERTARVRSARTDELGQLGAKFDRMLDELAQREEREHEAARQAFQARQEAEAALAEVRCHKFALDQHAIVAVTDPTWSHRRTPTTDSATSASTRAKS